MTDARTNLASHGTLRIAAPAVPYVAVVVGLTVLSNAWASILLYHSGMVILLTTTRGWVTPQKSYEVLCRRWMLLVTGAAALIGPIMYLSWSTVRLDGLELSERLAELGLVDHLWVLFVLYYFTVNPVLEEIYWRGLLGNDSTGLVWNDGFFAGYHVLVLVGFVGLSWVAVSFLSLVGAGWAWRQIERQCKSLSIPILSHAVADASLILAAFIMAS